MYLHICTYACMNLYVHALQISCSTLLIHPAPTILLILLCILHKLIIDGSVVLSDKEIAEKFFKDARSHGVSKETLKMTECHAPRFLTDIR
jgi:hypothetical protein